MTTVERIAQKLKDLPPERQQEVLDFVEALRGRAGGAPPLKSSEGLWADLGVDISEEDIRQARREMWGNFPRDIP